MIQMQLPTNFPTREACFQMDGTHSFILPSGYKYMNYHPYDNTTTDVEEYGLGMLAGGLISPKWIKDVVDGPVPTLIKLSEMGYI